MDVQFIAPAFSADVEQSYDSLLGALGTQDLEEHFFTSVHAIAEVDRIYCFELRAREAAPRLFCAWAPAPDTSALIDRYRTLYHRFDPIRTVLPAIPPASCAAITFHASEIAHSDYRESCFERFSRFEAELAVRCCCSDRNSSRSALRLRKDSSRLALGGMKL